ncbi:MAG: HupE/UreJ family protein [Thiobacillus sp.]
MSSRTPTRWIAATALALAAGTASAHTGDHAVVGFASGFAHPFLGLDHLLAMLAIGLWAAQQGGRALWAVPAAFLAAMGVGGALVWLGGALPLVETGIALSVLVLGLLIATRRQWAAPAGMAVAAGFALFHGYAHGLEMPQAASPLLYALGFVLATAALHAAGIAGNLLGRRAVQWAGAAIAATGLALIVAA